MPENKPQRKIELKPYQPFGIPLLKLLGFLALLSLAITAIYAFFF